MKIYNDVLANIMENGIDRKGRNGMTRGLFTIPMRFDLSKGFPAVTTKKLAFKAVKGELIWFLKGIGDDNLLQEIMGKDKTIWTANAQADYWTPKAKFPGDLGRVYGVQWRSWQKPNGDTVDQVAELVNKLKNNPNDRRMIVTAWNPGEIDQMALPPCHMMFQCYVADGKLSLHMFQRSCDMFLGVPFNIASYALLTHMLAQVADLEVGELILTLGDAHIYHDHFDAVKEQLEREPLDLPQIWLNPSVKDIDSFTMDDIKLENYKHHDPIKAKMAV